MEVTVLVLRIFLGAIFLISAVGKLLAPRTFVRNVVRYNVLPEPPSKVYGWLLPYAELASAIILFLGWQAQWGALIVIVMLLSFMVAVSIVMARHQNLSCSCFGLLYQEKVGRRTLIRDVVLLLMAVVIFIFDDGSSSVITSISIGFSTGMIVYVTAIVIISLISLGLGIISIKGYLFRISKPYWNTGKEG